MWRQRDAGGTPVRDVIGLADEALLGEPHLQELVRDGQRVGPALEPLDAARDRCASELERLPASLRSLEPADPPYPVEVSDALRAARSEVIARLQARRAE